MSSSSAALESTGPPSAVEFGPFRYDPFRRELVDGCGPLRLGSRALQILELLLESPGRLYSRDELVERVWPSTVVEETSLRVHVSALRRVLGDGQDGARYITNVPGRGYAFVGEARLVPERFGKPLLRPAGASALVEHKLPPRLTWLSRLTRPIGRAQAIAQLGELLSRQRLVTVVGAGGMGKTTVAFAVAEERQTMFAHGVFLVDLSGISDPGFVVTEFGRARGLNIAPGDLPSALEAELGDKQVLFVVDNCEHVIGAAAVLVDRLLRSCPSVRFLATSREPLEVETEWVFTLPPLAVPDPDEQLDIDVVLAYPAIQLFVERAKAISDTFELTEAHSPAMRQLCHFLDGIPLAIELAAARVDSLGVRGLLSRIENAFELLTRGRRTAESRHRTLQAVLDWSYELLSISEKIVLQRLSVFRGAFDLEGAVTVAACSQLPRQRVMEDVLSLCAKSLLVLDSTDEGVRSHRLLYITRLYAEKLLAVCPDSSAVHRRHASFTLERLLRAQEASAGMARYQWSPSLASSFSDLRAAIDWAMVRKNDLALGSELTAIAMLNYQDMGLWEEYRHHVNQALREAPQASAERARIELRLHMASTFISALSVDGGEGQDATFARTRELALEVGSEEDRIESLFGMGVGRYGQGNFRAVLAICDEIRVLATGDFEALSIAIADRLAAMSLHGLGDHDAGEQLAWRVMELKGARVGRRFLSEVPFGVSMRLLLAKIYWLRADFALAWRTFLDALELATESHLHARCQALGTAGIQMALWKGDRALADQWVNELRQMAEQKHFPYWQGFAKAFRRVLDGEVLPFGSKDSLAMEKCALLQDAVATLRACPPDAATLLRCEQGEVGWCAPEVVRLAAEPDLASTDAALRSEAAERLTHAMQLAQAQGARFWMLRVALTICSAALGGEIEKSSLETLRFIMASKDDGSLVPELVAARALLKGRA